MKSLKSLERLRAVLSFILQDKVVLTSSLDKILKPGHKNERYRTVFSFGTIYSAVQGCF